jgi:protein involved in polysaccharide export with SLBB domain
MEAGGDRPSRQQPVRIGLLLLLGLGAGCASNQAGIERAIMADGSMTARRQTAAEAYAVGCPDVIDVVVDAQPEMSGHKEVGPDGRIGLGDAGRVRVEGLTMSQIRQRIANETGLTPALVRIQMVAYNSQQVFLIGQVAGSERSVPYQGPETVLDLLHRAGGISPGAAPRDLHVVRAHVAGDRAPEVFHVDLQAIVADHDARTNIIVQPLDEVFVGESKTFSFAKSVPPWLRPMYDVVCGTHQSRIKD